MKSTLLAFFSFILINSPVFSMMPNEDAEVKSALEGACEICKISSRNKCAGCSEVFYCSREHQKQHWRAHKKECSGQKKTPKKSAIPAWASARLKKYIEFCQNNPTVGTNGSTEEFMQAIMNWLDPDLFDSDALEIIEIIQVALQNKPLAYNIETPTHMLLAKLPKTMGGIVAAATKDKRGKKLWKEVIAFAEERGAKVLRYTDETLSTMVMVFQENYRHSAQYFIDHKKDPSDVGDLEESILHGLLLAYSPNNIRSYCAVQFKLPIGNGQSEQQYQSAFERAKMSMESIIQGHQNF